MPRPKKPTALHKIEGTYQPCRHANDAEPKAAPMILAAPDWMTGLALEIYNTRGARLIAQGVLTENDADAWAACASMTAHIHATLASGNQPTNAEWTQYRMFVAMFGLDPASRSKVRAEKPPEKPTNPFTIAAQAGSKRT